MSLQFNDTTNKKGIIQAIERRIFPGSPGYISSDTDRLKHFTAEINIAFDNLLALIFKADGTWQFDDSNHTNYPIITTNLVDGQRDYTFTTDSGGNLILDVYRVAILASATATLYEEIYPVDQQSESAGLDMVAGSTVEGVPYRYDKTANGIFLDPIPSYNATNGLKMYINREASYFAYNDTTKKPGVAGIFHEYFALRPAYQYAYANNIQTAAVLRSEMLEMESAVQEYYSRRSKDERKIIRPKITNYI